jgi:hypothetical protein
VSKVTVSQIVNELANNAADPVSTSNFYDEVVYDLGRLPVYTNFFITAVVAGQNGITLPGSLISLRGIVYDDKWLTEVRLREIEPLTKMWRDITNAYPQAYVIEVDATNVVTLYPVPSVTGAVVTQVFGATYPAGNCVSFHTEYRVNGPQWIEWYLIFATLAREFSRASDHADPDAATAAEAISKFILGAYSSG